MACCGKNSLKMTRGDTRKFYFQRLNTDGSVIMIRPDKIYFTVKKGFADSDVILQKTIEDFEIDEEGVYHFTITPDDTNGMSFMTYVYDIEVITDGVKTTISKGEFTLEGEVTWAEDEV